MEQPGFRCRFCGRLHFDVPIKWLKQSGCWLKKNGKRRIHPCLDCRPKHERWPEKREPGFYEDEDPEEEGHDGVGFSAEYDRRAGTAYWDQVWGGKDDDLLD